MASPEIAADALTITLFGRMQVRVQGLLLPPFRSRKALWALALLILRHDRRVEREWLAATLWPDVEQSQAFANMRPVLSELRRALGEEGARLRSPDRQTLLLELGGANVDVARFDAAIKSGNLPDLEQAVALYGGPLLEDCQEEWAGQERASREQKCLQALQKLGEAALNAPDYVAAIAYYQRAARIDPWSDASRRGWMEALAKRGDRNAALQVYREFLNVLRSDPNAVPDEKTRALYERLRAEARPQASTPVVTKLEAAPIPCIAGYLPHPLTELVGREDDRLEVAERLRRSRLVTLTGIGGIGKTRLAMEVAKEVVQEYPDGVWLVALEALAEGKMVARQIASVLGLKEETGQTVLQSVIACLRTKRLLLALDNCEHLLEASAHIIAHLLQECVGVRILATSREPLGIAGENAWAVPMLAVPNLTHLQSAPETLLRILPGYASVELFVERAQAIQTTFALTRENALSVAQVCFHLEGIPLAIELAAVRVTALSIEQIAGRLDNELGLLTGESRTAQSRQQTLRATLDWSYALLAEPERQLLRRLSVFVGGWRLEAAEAVCAAEGIASSQILDLLLSLIDKSLVVFGGQQDGDGRYYLLEMVRQYAAESLQASGEAEQVKRRHQEWCLTFAEEAAAKLRTGDQEIWLTRLESDHGNLRAALARSLEIGVESGGKGEECQSFSSVPLRFCSALRWFWYTHAHIEEGLAWCRSALEAEGAQERTAARAKVLKGAGMLIWMQSDYAASRAYIEESLEIERELGNLLGIATSLSYLGNAVQFQGDYAAARIYYAQSVEIHRELGDRPGIAASLNNMGTVANFQGDYVAARAYLEESLGIERQIGSRRGVAGSLDNLGSVAHNQGDYIAAQAHYEESLAINREIGNQQGIAISLDGLGTIFFDQGDYATAQTYYEESLAIKREIGYQRGVTVSLHNLGNAVYHQGDKAAAQVYHKESMALRAEVGDLVGLASSLEAFAALGAVDALAFTASVDRADLAGETDIGRRRATRLWGAAEFLREQIGAPLSPYERKEYDRQVKQVRLALGDGAFTAGWEEGRALSWKQSIAVALSEPECDVLKA